MVVSILNCIQQLKTIVIVWNSTTYFWVRIIHLQFIVKVQQEVIDQYLQETMIMV